MGIARVGVVTGGPMALGIAEVCVRAGYNTLLHAPSDDLRQQSLAEIKASLERSVKKSALDPAQAQAALARLRGTTSLEDLRDCQLVVDALAEDAVAKRQLLVALDALCPPETIFACNTSVLPIGPIAAATQRLDRIVGLHFFLPVPVNKLVEVIRPAGCSDATLQAAREFVASLGKTAVTAPDTPAFIVVRLHEPYLLQAVRMLEAGIASKEDIDSAMVLGCGFPIGPLALIDYIGLDVLYTVSSTLYEEYREPMYAPPPLLRRMVLAGHLGRKTGQGFYEYP